MASSEGGFGGAQRGLLVAKQEQDRVLYVLTVDGAVKQAVIVHNGPATEGAGGPGWYVESWAHCDWQSMTFLHLAGAVYVRNPQPDLADFLATPYEEHADLPAHAVDTGYERNGDRLWLSTDKQRAFVGSRQGVEVWPRTVEPLGCA